MGDNEIEINVLVGNQAVSFTNLFMVWICCTMMAEGKFQKNNLILNWTNLPMPSPHHVNCLNFAVFITLIIPLNIAGI